MSNNTNILSLTEYINNKFNNEIGRRAVETIKQILEKTGHVPSVTTIARGAGFCTYHARLVEGIGVKPIQGHIVDKASGKGDDIHKILGLTSLRLFTDFNYTNIESIVRAASNKLNRYSLLQDRNEEQNIQTASKLLSNLINKLSWFEDILGIKVRDTYPIVEQQLIDYDLRMRGIPDLILEHKEEKKAIVIDWKTNKETPNCYESAQVICYALLEAKRLGYKKEEAIRSICGELKENKITSINILPIIIRPDERLALKPHPIFSDKSGEIRDRYEKFERLIRNVIIMAEHLTTLISNQLRLTGFEVKHTTGSIGQKECNYVRLTPFDLGLPRGNPNNQNKYPCNVCYLKEPCSFYFGHNSGTDDEEYNRSMWRLRFIVFDEKEEQLLPYLALYRIFDIWPYDYVISNLKTGKGFQYTQGFSPRPDDTIPPSIIIYRNEMGRSKTGEIRKRIDVIDNITVKKVSNNLSLILEANRPIRDYENEKGITYIINEGKTVLITIPYPRKDINPLLSINFFGKIDEVSIDNNIVSYTISLPSKILKYQTLVFTQYLDNNNFNDLIMVEMDVDLTRLELNAIDYLQRIINEDTNYTSNEEKDEKERELGVIQDSRLDGIDTDEGKEFEEFLKEIISYSRGADNKDGIQS